MNTIHVLNRNYSDTTLSIATVVGASAWGLYWYPLRDLESAGITGPWSVIVFNSFPLIVLIPLFLLNLRKYKGTLGSSLLVGFFGGMAFALYANSIVETTVVRAVLLFYLTPIWSTLLGVIWLGEKLTRARVVALVTGLTGLFLLMFDAEATGHPFNAGDVMGLLSGMAWAMCAATMKRWPHSPILPATTCTFTTTAALSAVLALIVYQIPTPTVEQLKIVMPSAAFWSMIIIMPSFMVIFRVSQQLYPGRVGILMMSEVIVAIISASLLLPEENMIWLQWVGAVGIIAAGFIEVLFGSGQEEEPAQQTS